MAVGKVLKYLGDYCRYSTALPGYSNLLDGLETDISKAESEGMRAHFVVPQKIPEEIYDSKMNQIRGLASHLFAGDEEVSSIFEDVEDAEIHYMDFATTKPLRVKLNFPGNISRTFYAKPLSERRLFGIELEHLLSPYKYEYSVGGDGMYEQEVIGEEIKNFGDEIYGDPAFAEQLVALDYRAFVMLLNDLNPEDNPHNCLVSRQSDRDGKYQIQVRPIDFDRLFDVEDLSRHLVLSDDVRAKYRALIGNDRYESARELERNSIKQRFNSNRQRINELLDVITFSPESNRRVPHLASILNEYYGSESPGFRMCTDMGELLGTHMDYLLGK